MYGLTFANHAWFWGLLLLLPLLVLRIRAQWATSRQIPGLVSPRLRSKLVSGGSERLRWGVFTLHAIAVTATITALAQPRLGFDEVESLTEGRNLILGIDTSRSMLAGDLAPNRLERAKLAAKDIVNSLPEDRIGILAFAGRPFLQAPLTVDHEAILESIDQLDTEIIPRGGTNIAEATALALETFAEAEVERSAFVVFSDGEALEGTAEIEAIRSEAREKGMTIIAIGVGTANGAIIPEVDDRGEAIPGVFIKDDAGQVVKTRLDAAALQTLASEGGVYIHLGGQSALSTVVNQIQKSISTSREDSETRLRPIERFMWPLSLAVSALFLAHILPMVYRPSFSRSLTVPITAIFSFLVPASLNAADEVFSGHEAYLDGRYDDAISVYEAALAERPTKYDRGLIEMGIGAAAFRQGDYERAVTSFGEALAIRDGGVREQAHYNLGNTLFRRGEASLQNRGGPEDPDAIKAIEGPGTAVESTIEQWESAIEHYEAALSINTENAKAKHNIEIVKKRLEELKQQEQEQQEQQDDEEEQEDKEEPDDKQDQEEKEESGDEKSEEDSEEDQEDESGDGEPEEKEDEGKPDEPSEEPGDKENEEPESENEGEEGDEEQESGGDPSEQSGDEPPGSPEQEQPDAPEDGELEANPNQEQPPQGQSQPNSAEMQRNPETGYSPTDARQLLEALADETEVRPILAPSRGEVYKDW